MAKTKSNLKQNSCQYFKYTNLSML